MHEVATSRRDAMRALAMIPAIIAAPAASAATGLVCAPTTESAAWDAALDRYKAILAEANTFWRNVEDRLDILCERRPSARDRVARLINIPAMRERSNAYGAQVAEAKDELRHTSAPTLAALLVKADLFFGDDECGGDGYGPAWHKDALAPFLSDLRRFAGESVA